MSFFTNFQKNKNRTKGRKMDTPFDLDSSLFATQPVFNANKYIVDSRPLSEEEFKLSLKPDNTSISVDLVNKEISFNAKKYL